MIFGEVRDTSLKKISGLLIPEARRKMQRTSGQDTRLQQNIKSLVFRDRQTKFTMV